MTGKGEAILPHDPNLTHMRLDRATTKCVGIVPRMASHARSHTVTFRVETIASQNLISSFMDKISPRRDFSVIETPR
jgi:hypothetical protein